MFTDAYLMRRMEASDRVRTANIPFTCVTVDCVHFS